MTVPNRPPVAPSGGARLEKIGSWWASTIWFDSVIPLYPTVFEEVLAVARFYHSKINPERAAVQHISQLGKTKHCA
jgi:hypothetical protein